jgi:hypothetical protein
LVKQNKNISSKKSMNNNNTRLSALRLAVVANGASAANAATSFNTPGVIMARDGTGSFQAQNPALNGNLYLPSATPGAGVIYSGNSPLISSFGTGNFFAGSGAGNLTISGYTDTGVGAGALQNNTGGSANTAVGNRALQSNTSGADNSASGALALQNNTTGGDNTNVDCTVSASGITGAGTLVATHFGVWAPSTAGTHQVLSDAQDVPHYDISFGDPFNEGHITHVVLEREDGDDYLVGTITSSFNQ